MIYEFGFHNYTGRMSEEEFLAALTGHDSDLKLAIAALQSTGQAFCIIGGLAVNHYVEPVVTLDADFAITASAGVVEALASRGFQVTEFANSINGQLPGSRLRLQITVNSRYAAFPARAVPGKVLGYEVPVASLEDLVQGKLWAATDPDRRTTKRQKDKLDLTRLCEAHPHIISLIPLGLIPELDAMRIGKS